MNELSELNLLIKQLFYQRLVVEYCLNQYQLGLLSEKLIRVYSKTLEEWYPGKDIESMLIQLDSSFKKVFGILEAILLLIRGSGMSYE